MSPRLACIVIVLGFSLAGCRPAPPAPPAAQAQAVQTLDQAVAWLDAKSNEMVRSSRRTMKNGQAAFPPQVGSGYEAFWLRDYAYALEGAASALGPRDLRDACLLFVNAQRADGAGVDCVKFDLTPIYQPGYGRMGANPVADGSQFTVAVAWLTWEWLHDKALLAAVLDKLVATMRAVPRNPQTRLVHIKPGGWDRCPYGFTDTVRKQGDVLFSSLLYVQACGQLADLLDAAGRADQAKSWRDAAAGVAQSARTVFWDDKIGLFRAATVRCREMDIWGSAFAVYIGVATREQSLAVGRYFRDHYAELVQHGQVRHLPGGVYWEAACPKDTYQNGGYWATPTGWFAYTLDLVDAKLADRTLVDLAQFCRQHGCPEWIFGDKVTLPGYLASATMPLAGARKMIQRRAGSRS